MSGEIETLAIKFYDEITDGDGFTHSKDEIQKLIDVGYIVPMPKRGHYSMTGSLIDLINDRRGDPDWNGGGEEKYRPLIVLFVWLGGAAIGIACFLALGVWLHSGSFFA